MKRNSFLLKFLISCMLLLAACTALNPATPTPTSPATATPSPLPSATPTPPPSATSAPSHPVRFAVIGDYGSAGADLAAVAALVKSWQVDFIVTTGDNNYPNGAAETIDANIGQYFHDYIYPYTGDYGPGAKSNRFFPTLGNHDWLTDNAQPYLDYFTLPGNERYYDFRQGPLHFFMLDSDGREPDGIGRSSVQAAWLQAAMAASTARWKIVVLHHPPYSSAYHGSQDAMQWPYAAWGATAVLAGHEHVYERLVVDGTPYFINGLGGYPVRYSFLLPLPGSQLRYRQQHGAMRVQADEVQIVFEFVSVDGEVVDRFVIEGEE